MTENETKEYLRDRYLKKYDEEIILMNSQTFDKICRSFRRYELMFDSDNLNYNFQFCGYKVLIDDDVPNDKFVLKKGKETVSIEDATPYYRQ